MNCFPASVEVWDRLHSVNARGTFLCYKYAAKQMIAQGRGGRIIGASSICGKRGVHELNAARVFDVLTMCQDRHSCLRIVARNLRFEDSRKQLVCPSNHFQVIANSDL